MAKLTVGEVVMEGTIAELREWAELSGVEFPTKAEEQPEPNYRKIDKADAKVGDFVKFAGGTEDSYDFVTVGNYYEITGIDSSGDYEFIDDDGDEMDTDDMSFEVYTLRQPEEEPAVEPLKVGDYAKITGKVVTRSERGGHAFEIGEIVKVVDVRTALTCEKLEGDTPSNQYVSSEDAVQATDAEVAEAKAAAHTASFKVGDYAKLKTVHPGLGGFRTDEIVKVIDLEAGGRYEFQVFKVNSRIHGYTNASNLEKVSAEEVAKIKAEAKLAEKWANIGRKPNEFKKGDIVKVLIDKACRSCNMSGDIGEITVVSSRDFKVEVPARIGDGNFHGANTIELITPVEARFDLKGGQ